MSISAQLAQGAKVYIAGTGGAAKNITAITVGNPTIITSAAHGFSNGDVIAVAAITGTVGTDSTNGLNGKTLVVTNVTTNTFAVQVNTTGLAYTSGGTATPNTWTQVKQVKGIKSSGASANPIEVTDLDSTGKEFLSGLPDNGTLSLDIFYLTSDAGQAAVLAQFNAGTSKNYKLTTAAGTNFTFNASILKYPTVPETVVDGVLVGTVDLKISGAVTVA